MFEALDDRTTGPARLTLGLTGHADERRIERVLLVAVVLVLCCAAWLVATARDAVGETAPVSPCVTEAVDGAQAFAAVLGDHRPVDGTFARQQCRDGAPRS